MKTRRAEAYWLEDYGRWQINVQREGRRKTFSSSVPGRKGKHEAEEKADKWLEDFADEQTVSRAWELMMQDAKKTVSCVSYGIYERVWKCHVAPYIPPSKKLSTVTIYDWQNAINHHQGAKSTCNLIRTLITMLVNYSQKRGWNVRAVDGKLEIPEHAKEAKQKRALTPNELHTLMSIDIHDSWYANTFQLIVLTGLRRSEAAALKWEDIDTEKRCINLSRGMDIYGNETTGKTKNAVRTVPLQSAAVEVIERQRQQLKDARIVSPNVFPSIGGKQIARPDTLNKEWERISRERNIGVTLHELRHTFISICKSDMPIALLKQAVGHSASMDTLGVYGHNVDGDNARAAEIIDLSFANAQKNE